MFNSATNIDASHSTFSEVHRDQHFYSSTHVEGDYTVNNVVHGNQVYQGSLGLENLYHASVPSASFDSIDRHPAPTCLPGTRQELLARLVEWVDDPKYDLRVCWLSGLAGSGKSAIAQSIAETYASRGRLAASFFFSRKEASRRKAHGFFPTIACQLLAFVPSIRSALLGALDVDAAIPTKVLPEQARRLLLNPILSTQTSFPHPILIVVDSLDECDDAKMANEIVRLLAEILGHHRWPLKVLFTSRVEPRIVQVFEHPELRDITHSLRLQDFEVDNDIRIYLHHSFENIRKSMDSMSVNNYPSPWPSIEEIEMIVQKAAGLFIFATTVVKYVSLDSTPPVAQLQAVLHALQNGASAENALLHSALDTLYLDALRRIPDAGKVRSALGLVVFAFQPLSICGLGNLLWDFQLDASYIVKNLRSVLVISESTSIKSDDAVRIYHTSFRDFLTSSYRSQQYWVDPLFFHEILARSCLGLMVRHLTTDMCNIGDPSVKNCEIKDLETRRKLNIKDGVRYACRWSQVSWDARVDDALVLNLQGFATRNLLNWIEVLSLIGELDSAIPTLREVIDWLKGSPDPSEETLTLLHEAEKLVLMCYQPIQQAALQVYYSFPCVPARALIRTTYTHELKNKYMITHGLDDHWKHCLRSVSTGIPIRSLAISVSGRLIASAGDAPGVQLWDALTGKNTGNFCGDGTSSCPVVFSPSGDNVAIGYNTGTIDIWDVTTGERLLEPSQGSHNASVTVLAFSWNSLFMASAAVDGIVHVWDISTRNFKHSAAYHKGPIFCLVFAPSNGLVASGSDDATITTSDIRSGRLVRTFRGHESRVNSIAFSFDSETIASGSDDQSVRLWDTQTGVCLRTFTGRHKKPIRQVWITADSKHIVSVCNMDIYMWETTSPHQKSPQHIWSVSHFFKKGASMFPVWYAKLVKLFPAGMIRRFADLDDGSAIYTAPSPDGMALGCAYSSCVLFFKYSTPQNTWSRIRHPLATPSTLDEPPLSIVYFDDTFDFTAAALTHDATLLITSTNRGDINIWNTSPKSSWKTFQDNFKRTAEQFWPAADGHSLLVKRTADLQLVLPAGTLIKEPDTGPDTLGTVGAVPSPDSRYFAYWAEYAWNVDKSFSIYIYDASTGIRLKRVPGFFNIACANFSVDGNLFACAHGDGIVQIWELPSVFSKTTVKTGHTVITALEWLPGNATIVIGNDKGCVEIRSVEDGEVVHCIECSPSKVSVFAVRNDALIIIGHADGSIFVWDPSFTNVAPYCLFNGASDDADHDPDGVDFIKFTESQSGCISTRSAKGVICTWDLTHCITQYAKQAKETSAESATANIVAIDAPTSQPALAALVPSDSSTELDGFSAQNDAVAPNDSMSMTPTSAVPSKEVPEPHSNTPSQTVSPITPTVSTLPCPSLVSRSGGHIVYDRYFRSPYAIDVQEGWVCCGSRRLFWLPDDLRPASPTALSAFGDRLTVLTRAETMACFDLGPMKHP